MISAPSGLKALSSPRRLLTDTATDWVYAAGWLAVRAAPEFAARNVFDAGARYAARGGGPEQLRKNLARVIGVAPAEVPDELLKASLASYGRYWREAFRLPTMDHRVLAQQVDATFQGAEHIDASLAEGRGVVLALPHSGNWDMAGVWLAQTRGTFTTVAERLKPESLYRRFIAYRESLGFEVLPLSGGDRPPFEVLCERLRSNRVVCLMAERDLTRTGVEVDFFGEPTRMPAGPAKLAVETGAALCAAHCWNDGVSWPVSISAPLDCSSGDVKTITQTLADHFAVNIAAHPEDWHMLQPQWLADLSDARRARLEGG
ncbi:phosphatidylinositol mannoside acyltransferase [Mycobacterium shigaense]|uniref:Phosphatidylinositol mannoside acyltransferase n=1 Tax=Mycobacterium shigaense TaxID=722731 RepID=A0A1Z4EGH8_9MYCO|nr:phosphatidylinositol mannoside acyltransferase [Mycobacterium shigaense]PRI16772.1 phosphatidylinositol mannoside acyltransferase [Mycobacterium shigaense]BAX92085.1 phosphatidylinositol mannoside acyltransferase [Mycobacterium shigaense]